MHRTASGLLSWARQRPRLTALVLFTFLSLLFFAPGLVPGHTTSAADFLWNCAPWNTIRPKGLPRLNSNPPVFGSNSQLVDAVTVFEPFLQYTRSQLPHIPLWDPYIMGGTPYMGDMQSAVLSPFSLPAYVLPFWWSLSVIGVLKVLTAAMGTFLLGRALKMRFAGAFLAGAVYGFGLFMVVWLPWPLSNVFALIPWMLLATERIIRRPDAVSAAGLAVVVALQWFGGHPESSFHALFATVAFFVLRVLQLSRRNRAWHVDAFERARSWIAALARAVRRPVLMLALALVMGCALAAIVLVPFSELLRNSSDLTARPRGGVYVSPKYFIGAFMPNYFPGIFDVAIAFYAGALALMLALVALLRVRLERIAIAVFAAVSIAVVLGVQPFFGVVRRLPGFDVTYNSRLTILYLLCVALLAGWGLSDLVERIPGRRQAVGSGVIAGGLIVLPVVWAMTTRGFSARFFGRAVKVAWELVHLPSPTPVNMLLVTYRDSLSVIHLASLIVWVVVAGVAALLLYARVRRGFAAGPFAVLAILLVLADLFMAGMGKNPAISDSHAEQPVTAAIRYLEQHRPSRYVALEPSVGVNALPPDVNLRYGIYDARGYDLPVVTRFGRLWTRYIAPPNFLLPLDTPAVPTSGLDQTSLRILSLLGVTDLLQEKGQPQLQLNGLHIAYDGSDATIYANDDALPRTWLVADQEVVKGDGRQLTQIASPGFDPRRVLITQTKLPGLAQGQANDASPGEARLSRYGAEKVTIAVHADRSSEVVLSDVYYPGWHATVDGRPVRIDRVDYLLRGVPVGPGTHRVELSYDPASFRIGWLVSLAALLIVAGMIVVGVRHRRRRALLGAQAHGQH
jgi:hypothetical protein